MPPNKTILRWKDDPEYNALSSPRKQAILESYFDSNVADDEEFQNLPEERKAGIRNNFTSYHMPPEAPPAQVEPPPPQPQRLGMGRAVDYASTLAAAGVTGAAEGLTTELPGMAGRAMEFVGSYAPEEGIDPTLGTALPLSVYRDVGKDLSDWAEAKRLQWFGPPKKLKGVERWVREGAKMLGPSVVPGLIVSKGIRVLDGIGKLVKASKAAQAAGNVAKAAELMDMANKAAGMATKVASVATASMFGLSQAQQTRETAEGQAKHLESQDKFEEAKKVRAQGQGFAPYATGGIEGLGEYWGTKFLMGLFGADKIAKRGMKNVVKQFLKETLGVEVSTEVIQQAGQAGVEKITGIRPEADPLAEALDVVGPTIVMSLFGLTGGTLIDTQREPTDSINILDEVKEEAKPAHEPVNINLIKKQLKAFREEMTGRPSTAEEAAEVLEPLERAESRKLVELGVARPGFKSAEVSARAFEDEMRSEPPIGAPSTAREAAETLVSPEAVREEEERREIQRRGLEIPEDIDREQIQRLGLRPPPDIKSAEEAARVFEEEPAAAPIGPPTPIPAPSLPPTALAEKEITPPKEEIDATANEAATSPLNALPEPSEAQKKAGNYKLGHVNIQGLDISIENPKGSKRSGKDKDGETWETKMKSHYGYIKGKVGKDKDPLDVFIGDNPESKSVFVVDQINPDTGEFDEHKVMLGFKNKIKARKGYLENYEKGWKGLGAITKMSVEEFKEWSANKEKTKLPLKYEVPKDARKISTHERRLLREKEEQLEKEKPEQIPVKPEETAVTEERKEKKRPDIQLTEKARREASEQERVKKSLSLQKNKYVKYMKKKEGLGEWRRSLEPALRLSATMGSYEELLSREHKNDVRNALKKGKFVPPEVLKDYPDLVKPGDIIEKPGKKEKREEKYAVSKKVSPLGFYSAVQEAVDKMDFKKIPADDLSNRIKKLSGIKAEELEHLGLTDWLDGLGKDKVTKEQVEEFINQGGVQLEEIVLGKFGQPKPTKYEQWQMPGEKENYREVLLKLPTGFGELVWRKGRGDRWGWFSGNKMVSGAFPLEEDKERARQSIKTTAIGFTGSHFDEPNVIAHVRLNDRVDSEGNKTLFIEEIQSDWHQKARKEGYGKRFKTGVSEDENVWVVYSEDGTFVDVSKRDAKNKEEAILYAKNHPELSKHQAPIIGVPDAPFKTSWPLLVFKRVLRIAADEGYDSIAWTPGEVQADRYDLSKQISELLYKKNKDGSYRISAQKDGRGHLIGESIPENKLEDYVGKEISKKIIDGTGEEQNLGGPGTTSQPKDIWKGLKGVDLKVGGQGMKGFYDKMLPKIVGKYVKKLDKQAKVGTTRVNVGIPSEEVPDDLAGFVNFLADVKDISTQEYHRFSQVRKDELLEEFTGMKAKEFRDKSRIVWSLPLTDNLKTEILGGQPLFNIKAAEALGLPTLEKIVSEMRTPDLIESVFPGQDIKDAATGYEVTFKSGLVIQVERVPGIEPEPGQLAAWGKKRLEPGEYVAGVYKKPFYKTDKPLIRLSRKADKFTLHHESIHLLEDFGIITKLESGRINRHIRQKGLWDKTITGAENRANWLANEANKPAPATKIGKIWAKIKDFVDNLVNKFGFSTVRGIVRDIKTGKIYEKEAPKRPISPLPEEQYSVKREDKPTEESIEQPGLLRRQWDEIVFQAQDKFHYLNKAQVEAERRNRAELPEEQDAYAAETRYHGIASAAIEDFEEEHVEPMLDLMGENNITFDELGDYLHARHAREANEVLMERNPDLPNNEALSGMTDEDADLVLESVSGLPISGAFEELGRLHDRMTKAHRDILRESGQVSPETIKQWEDTYDFYAPLFREGVGEGRLPRRGKGFDVRWKQKIRAGSHRPVINIMAHAVANTQAAMIRAEKLKVARTFLGFARNNPGPWEIDTVEYTPSFDAAGLIQYRPDPSVRWADNVMVVKEGGINHRITFDQTNLNAMRIASAMKNLDAGDIGSLTSALLKVNRYLAMVNTALNPEFIISNFLRDIQTAGYNMSDSAADAIRMKAFRDVKSAWRGIRDFQKGNKDTDWAKRYDRFRKAGAKVGWMQDYSDIPGLQKDMVKKLKHMHADKKLTVRRGLNSVMKFVEQENTAVENAVRLSVFKNLIENDVSEAKAAVIAKELTVNFNRKGNMGLTLNSMYLFYNASIQGSARLIDAARTSPKVRKMMVGTVAFAAALDVVNRAIGGVDDDGEDRYDKIAPWVKERNIILMLPDGKGYVKIMMPWGYNIFHVMGQVAGEAISKEGFDPVEGATRVAGATISSFNPVGGEASILQVLSPTLIDPLIQWAENKDWAGRKLRPDSNPFSEKPDSQRYWNSVRAPSKVIAEKLNELTGGDVIKPGKVDISPEAIDLAIDTFTGGVGKFVGNLISTPIKLAKGEDVESYEIPMLRRVYGKIGKQALTQDFYENIDAVRLVRRQLKHYKDDKKKIKEIKKQSPAEIKMLLFFLKKSKERKKKGLGKLSTYTISRELSKLRKKRKQAKALKNKPMREKKVKALNEKIESIMKNFNKRYQQYKGKE